MKFPLDTSEWELKDGTGHYPPEEWRSNLGPPMEQLFPRGLVLVLAWLEGGHPRTLWARRRQ